METTSRGPCQGELREDSHFYEGMVNGDLANTLPMTTSKELLERGQERYNIYCSPCHDRTGQGNGIIVKRGLKQPTSFHDDRLKQMPVGYFFDVITNGYGVMYSYASRTIGAAGLRGIYPDPPTQPEC